MIFKALPATVATLAFATLLCPALAAQTPAPCAGLSNSVCVTQIGSGNATTVFQTESGSNSATIYVEGERNGQGTIPDAFTANVSLLTPGLDGALSSALGMPALESGLVTQEGDGNQAAVVLHGDDNQFRIAQQGDTNSATQIVKGSANVVAVVQGAGLFDSGNESTQIQIGSGNVGRVLQKGSNNIAVQVQAPSAELAILGFAGAGDSASLLAAVAGELGSADFNTILLEQNGDDNQAYLAQIGFNNDIALRQQGNAQITITQYGVGHSIGVEQPAGSQGVQITQY